MNHRGIISSYLLSPLSKITKPENSTQDKLVKDSSSNRVNDLFRHKTKPITLHDNLLTFRDTDEVFELKGGLLKMITNKNYNIDLANLSDKKFMYNFANEMHFDVRGQVRKYIRNGTLTNLLRSPAIMASGISNALLLSSAFNELCNRLKLLLQKKRGNKSDIIDEKIVAIVNKILKYKCIFKKQPKQFSNICNLLHK